MSTITSKAGNAVLMSEEDYEAWQTVLHLFSTSANARRLSEALERSTTGLKPVGEIVQLAPCVRSGWARSLRSSDR